MQEIEENAGCSAFSKASSLLRVAVLGNATADVNLILNLPINEYVNVLADLLIQRNVYMPVWVQNEIAKFPFSRYSVVALKLQDLLLRA